VRERGREREQQQGEVGGEKVRGSKYAMDRQKRQKYVK
jgi:hypothetical protein